MTPTEPTENDERIATEEDTGEDTGEIEEVTTEDTHEETREVREGGADERDHTQDE